VGEEKFQTMEYTPIIIPATSASNRKIVVQACRQKIKPYLQNIQSLKRAGGR
jgi:hypothetical protein